MCLLSSDELTLIAFFGLLSFSFFKCKHFQRKYSPKVFCTFEFVGQSGERNRSHDFYLISFQRCVIKSLKMVHLIPNLNALLSGQKAAFLLSYPDFLPVCEPVLFGEWYTLLSTWGEERAHQVSMLSWRMEFLATEQFLTMD